MTNYVTTYLQCADADAFASYLNGFRNVIGPVTGRAATAETTDAEGNVIPAQPAVGDPAMSYACVRALFAGPEIDGVTVCDTATGEALLGVWA